MGKKQLKRWRRFRRRAIPAAVVEWIEKDYTGWDSDLIQRLTTDPEMDWVFSFLEASFDEAHQQVFFAAAVEADFDGTKERKCLAEAKLVQEELLEALRRTKSALLRLNRLGESGPSGLDVPYDTNCFGLDLYVLSDGRPGEKVVRERDIPRLLTAQRWQAGVLDKIGASNSPSRRGSRVSLRVARRRSMRFRDPCQQRMRQTPTHKHVNAALAKLPKMDTVTALVLSSRHPYAREPREVAPLELVSSWLKFAEDWKPSLLGKEGAALARTAHRGNEYLRAFWYLLNHPSQLLFPSFERPAFGKNPTLLGAIATTADIALNDPEHPILLKDVRNALKGKS